jgi:hypothetical protein
LTTDVARQTLGDIDKSRATLTHAWLNPNGLDYALSAEGWYSGRASNTRLTINGLVGDSVNEARDRGAHWGLCSRRCAVFEVLAGRMEQRGHARGFAQFVVEFYRPLGLQHVCIDALACEHLERFGANL